MDAEEMTLEQLKPETAAVVTGFDGAFSASRRERFEDLGLLPGAEVRRLHTAPLGDPAAYQVGPDVLCLRAADARHVKVRALP